MYIIPINIIMKQSHIYIFLSLVYYCFSTHLLCPNDRPFITGDEKHVCKSFSDICLKSESEDCAFAIKACKQCPLSNFSSAILDRVLKTMYIGENKNCTPAKIESKPIKECPTNPLLWIILIGLFILIILIMVYLVKNRKKGKNTPLRNVFSVDSGKKEENIPLRNGDTEKKEENTPLRNLISVDLEGKEENTPLRNVDTVDNTSYPPLIDSISDCVLKQILKDQIRKLQEVTDIIGVGICFKIPESHKSLKLIVHENDNIVSIKRKICAKLVNTKKIDDFKMMQFQYNGEVLDNNQYLPKIVGLEPNSILCFINEELKNRTTLLQLRGNIYVPEMIQLEKSVYISQLKQIVNEENINLNNLFIIKGSEILESNKTIEECELEDNDLLKVIKNENRTINVKQIFKDYATHRDVALNIDNIEKVGEIKSKILTILDIKQEKKDILIFHGSNHLNDDMFFFEFDSGESDKMSYCNLVDAKFLIQNQELKRIGTGDHNEIYEWVDWSKRKIILKKSNKNIKENHSLINELMVFHETKSHSRFVQLLGIFIDENSFYVAVEKMSDNSISDVIKEKFPISESRIIKWSQQILDGLEFLHNRQIIHRNIKPSNILLNDDGNNAKISSFGLSRHLYGKRCVMENDLFSKVDILRYMAPEMYVEMVYDFKSEVYSFGVTLREIITGKIPYEDQLNDDDALEQIRNMGPLVFSSENQKLESFVNSCLQRKPEDRPFISDLLKLEPF